jgi:hypothetical protein
VRSSELKARFVGALDTPCRVAQGVSGTEHKQHNKGSGSMCMRHASAGWTVIRDFDRDTVTRLLGKSGSTRLAATGQTECWRMGPHGKAILHRTF